MQEQAVKSKGPNKLLRYERESRGWSRDRMAEEPHNLFSDSAATGDMISRWERRKRNPSAFYREKLCILFQKTAADLGLLDEVHDSDVSTLEISEVEPEPRQIQQDNAQIILLTSEELAVLQNFFGETNLKTMFDPAKRRTLQQVIATIGAVASGSGLALDSEPWDQLHAAQVKPSTL